MENICPNCGYKYKSEDLFCARCGKKLYEKSKSSLLTIFKNFEIEKKIEKDTKNDKIPSEKKNVAFNAGTKTLFDNILVSALIVLLILAISVVFLLFFVIRKHDKQKDILQYKNYISNPAQIPLLKEPSKYIDLFKNLNEVEGFLLQYIKYSSDTKENKMNLFALFLKELDKTSYIVNEKFIHGSVEECKEFKTTKACVSYLNKNSNGSGVKLYAYNAGIYLFPDYDALKKRFYSYLDYDFKKYVSFRKKFNTPVAIDLNLLIEPKQLADKIYANESLLRTTQNAYIKDSLEEMIYFDFRKFIFTPSIYDTTTHEMKQEFESAYRYYINSKKDSVLRPVVMSYFDKKRGYSENNFSKDYPLQIFKNRFDVNIEQSSFNDVFSTLRKNAFIDKSDKASLNYVYDVKKGIWKKYDTNVSLIQGEYVVSEPDENNNISIYNHMFSPMQELNIYKYSKLYLINDGLYIFNKDKLSILKVTFNGKIFNLYNLSNSDVANLFPNTEIINMDAFSSYNIMIEKANKKANYILISRYSQGWHNYNLKPIKGDFNILTLPNMFAVNSNEDITFSFSVENENTEEISESSPSYKFTIKTQVDEVPKEQQVQEFIKYDEKTKKEQHNIEHDNDNTFKPNIMPKLMGKSENIELERESLSTAPVQSIDPPDDDGDN